MTTAASSTGLISVTAMPAIDNVALALRAGRSGPGISSWLARDRTHPLSLQV